ncbi:MAG: hypothetical protein PWP51_2682 [Clostridiales bacterium]|jgi:hypothetical protein|nr:hypothetical protein [Clostridiales bacterium]MDN5300129.1 hypothetical protein [Clostridiales bacterium]
MTTTMRMTTIRNTLSVHEWRNDTQKRTRKRLDKSCVTGSCFFNFHLDLKTASKKKMQKIE